MEPRRENWNHAVCSAHAGAEFEAPGACHKMGVVFMSTWVCKNSGRHAIVETRELVHGHEGSTG